MTLHKQLRVLSRGTPCMILDIRDKSCCVYSGTSDEILSRLTNIGSGYRDSFVKEVKLDNEPELALKIYVKLKEAKFR